MRAEVVSVGTELLMGQIVDTNAAVLSRTLAEVGVMLFRRTTVGDNADRMRAAFGAALAENDILITIGGLGPTQDDITRDVLAETMGVPLRFDEGIADALRRFFRSRGIGMPESVLRQAMVPTRGRPLANPNGTAPGLLFEAGGKLGIALPGPPGEFVPMLQNEVVPVLRERTGGRTIFSRVVRIAGLGESMVEERLIDLMSLADPTVAPYAKTGEVHVRVSSLGESREQAEARVMPVVAAIERRLGSHVYGFDDEPLEFSVVRLARAAGCSISTAESCTGGMLAARITNVPGSSAVFPGGIVSYANEVKAEVLGVPLHVLERHGAVSPETAEAMALGAVKRFGTRLGVGITGIAGPDGGSAAKPVGLVFIGIADGAEVSVEKSSFPGERDTVRTRSVQRALTLLRDHLIKTAAQPASDG